MRSPTDEKEYKVKWESYASIHTTQSLLENPEKKPVYQKQQTGDIVPVAYAENFHGGFIQWHMVVICISYVLFVTSQFDVVFMFPNQRFGDVF